MKFLAKAARETAFGARAKGYNKRMNEIYKGIKQAASVGVTHKLIFIDDLPITTREKILAQLREDGYRIIGPMANGGYIVRWTL